MPRTALVTGASRGIGLALCKVLIEQGWNVIPAVRQLDDVEELLFPSEKYLLLDLAKLDQIEPLVKQAEIPSVDVLVNCAGDFGNGAFRFFDFDPAIWERTLRVNLLGPALLSRLLLPSIAASNEKKLVFVSTGNASIAENKTGEMLAYRTSKTALNQLCRTLSCEVGRLGITAACVDPGWVRTRMGGTKAPLAPRESAISLSNFIENLRPEHNGNFFSTSFHRLPY